MDEYISNEELLEEANIIKKIDANFPPSELMGDVMIHCFCKKISLIIAHQVPTNKSMWEHQLNPDVKRIVGIITEQESDIVKDQSEPNDLLKMNALVQRYAQMCRFMDTNYVYAYSYQDRVFYDVSGVGDLEHPDDKKMWKLEILTPGRVKKKVRAKKEPAQEYLMDLNGIKREILKEDEPVLDLDELFGTA